MTLAKAQSDRNVVLFNTLQESERRPFAQAQEEGVIILTAR